LQYVWGFDIFGHPKDYNRLRGPFTKLVVGIYLAKMTYPILGMWLYRTVKERNHKQSLLALVFVIASFGTIVISNERTALMTFTVGLGVIGLVMLTRKVTRLPAILTGFGVAITGIVLYTTQPILMARAHDSHQQLGDFKSSPYGQLWFASVKIWEAHPIVGTGMYGFRYACPILRDQGVVTICDLHSHNTYLEFLAETGTIGFVAYLMFIFLLLRLMIKTPLPGEEESLILRTFAIATFIPTFFPLAATQSFFSNWAAWLAWFSFGVSVMMIRCISKKA
jgi:O-antigen ligase